MLHVSRTSSLIGELLDPLCMEVFCDLHAQDRTCFEFQAKLRSELGLELKGQEELIPSAHTCGGNEC